MAGSRGAGKSSQREVASGAREPTPENLCLGQNRKGSEERMNEQHMTPMEIAVSRNQHSTFEPRFIGKGQRRFEGFDERIIAMYARGMPPCCWQFPPFANAGETPILRVRHSADLTWH